MAGDFNNDGYYDLAIAVKQEDLHGMADVRAVHILYGSSAGLQISEPADQIWDQNVIGIEDVAERDDALGHPWVNFRHAAKHPCC